MNDAEDDQEEFFEDDDEETGDDDPGFWLEDMTLLPPWPDSEG